MNKRILFLGLWVVCLSLVMACSRRNGMEGTLERAGKNRAELEKVLEHYAGDELKYKAACYLIKHMENCYFYADPRIDSLKSLRWMATVYREGPWLDSVKRVWSHFSYRDTRKVYDAEVITADYLIDNIDHAFEVWGKRPWAKYYSFDDFCEYVLPYRIANEPLEAWRRVYYDRYAATVDSMYGGSDVLEVVKAVRKKFKEEGFIWNTHFSLPHCGGLFLLDHHTGQCPESCDITVYILRALGIPVGTDCYIASPYISGAHSWTILRDTTGLFVPFWITQTEPERGADDGRPKGKVFRKQYWGQLEDVTAEYFGKNSAKVKIQCPPEVKEVSLCIFSCGAMTAVDRAERAGQEVTFHNLEPGIRFLPMYQKSKGGVYSAAGYPFSLDKDGKVHTYVPDTLHTRTAELFRKYPLHIQMKEYVAALTGSIIEGARSADFRQTVLLAHIKDTIRTNYVWLDSLPDSPVRYIRITPPGVRYTEIAEIAFYGKDGLKLDAELYRIPAAMDLRHTGNYMTDGDILSYYQSKEQNREPITVDLKKECRVDRIHIVPRNDDNFIRPGDEYELFYQNGAEGWISLGRQTAVTDRLKYDRIPSGAVLWLRDLSRGREEQLFILKEHGEQFFY